MYSSHRRSCGDHAWLVAFLLGASFLVSSCDQQAPPSPSGHGPAAKAPRPWKERTTESLGHTTSFRSSRFMETPGPGGVTRAERALVRGDAGLDEKVRALMARATAAADSAVCLEVLAAADQSPSPLLADLAGVVASIVVCSWFFGGHQ